MCVCVCLCTRWEEALSNVLAGQLYSDRTCVQSISTTNDGRYKIITLRSRDELPLTGINWKNDKSNKFNSHRARLYVMCVCNEENDSSRSRTPKNIDARRAEGPSRENQRASGRRTGPRIRPPLPSARVSFSTCALHLLVPFVPLTIQSSRATIFRARLRSEADLPHFVPGVEIKAISSD